MQESAGVALQFNSSGRKAAKAQAAPPPESINLVRLSPARVSIKSELLFDPRWEATAREFLIRVFGLEEVGTVTFRRRQARVDVRLSPTATASEAWPKLAAALRSAGPRDAAMRDLLEHRVASLRLVESVAETTVRVTRLGDALTTWRVTQHSRTRLRFSHPALRRRRDVLHHFRMEVASIYGVEALSTNVLTASVWVNFDPNLINAEQLVSAVERSWPAL